MGRRLLLCLVASLLWCLGGLSTVRAQIQQPPPVSSQTLSVKAYGATGDGTTDDTAAITAALTAAQAGDTIFFPDPAVHYKLTSALTISKALTLAGDGATLKQATTGTRGLVITASKVTVRGLTLLGAQASTYNANERAIDVTGASWAARLTQIKILDCGIDTWGSYGIWLKYVTNFEVSGTTIGHIVYAGLMTISAQQGRITNNVIDTITPGTAANMYGIALTREDVVSLVTDPRSSDIVVADNYVANIPVWEGIDTHCGERLTITGNVLYNVNTPILLGSSNGDLYAPLDLVVADNVMDSSVTDGTRDIAILVHGAGAVHGTPVETAKGVVITGNTIRGYGAKTSTQSSAIFLYNTEGAVISNNSIYQPSPAGINMSWNNFGFTISGNTIVDPWIPTSTGASAFGIAIWQDFNTGYIGGNTIRRGTKVDDATVNVLTGAIHIADYASNKVSLGVQYSDRLDWDPMLTDAGKHAESTFVAPLKVGGANGGCLMFRDTNGSSCTKCKTLAGVMTCTTDADCVCD